MANSDEAVVRTRLLLDGDVTGDDRRLNNLCKMVRKLVFFSKINSFLFFQFLKWTSTKDYSDSEKAREEDKKQFSRLMASMAQCEWTESKSKMVQEMNRKEAENYQLLFDNIKTEITKAEVEIRETKEELISARKIRKNRMEYDALAKVINENPDRATQGLKIEEIKSELEKLKETEAALEDKLESRKKQFHVLVQSIHNLQQLLNEDNEIGTNFEPENGDETKSSEDVVVMET